MKKILAFVLLAAMLVCCLVSCGEKDNQTKKNAEYIHYSRAGYGKLGFRADFGPVQFTEVRQAIAFCMDRDSFAKAFTGGYGGVVDGPYYSGAWMYKAAIADGMTLNSYETSEDSAKQVLIAGGWIYGADGNAYTSGVRYKNLGSNPKAADITYQSKDGAYKTVKVGENYFMPLALNWYGSENNEFTDLLVTDFANNTKIANAGFNVQYTIGTFSALLGELYQYNGGGYSYGGTPMYSCFNFATSFSSAVYDYSWNCTIDPAMFEDYSQWYIKDEADIIFADGTVPAAGSYVNLDGKTYGEEGDYWDLYNKLGADVKASDVKTNAKGLAYITVESKDYILGLDFLSMAMVYNATTDAEYADWWRFFITRWNSILPEVPLYSNEYYDLYNTKLGQVEENPTNPFWGTASALIDWTSADNKIIIGSTTELSGMFRNSSFGVSSPAASNNDVQGLTTGLETVVNTKEGGYVWNSTVVKSHTEKENEDGSKTYTIEIYDDLKFSDGSAITAKNYLVSTLAYSTKVMAAASGRDSKSAMTVVGYEAFAAYDGTNDGVADGEGEDAVVASKALSGLRLLDTYKFSVTIAADYLPYFYDITYASFGPTYMKLWLGNDADIKDDGNGAYITDAFYATTGEGETKAYAMVAHIVASAANTNTDYPYSGPYVVKSYDASAKEATLEINPYFKGNYEGHKPAIQTVVYKLIVSATQMDDFKAGGVDVLAGITGGTATNEAIAYADGTAQ